jgi:tetratricopeptide (TPR) repeat protein
LSLAVPAQGKGDASRLFQEGAAAANEGDFERAIPALKKVTEAEPKNARAWLLLGYSLHGNKQLDDALPVHLKAAEFPDVAAIATYNVACVYSLKGEKDKAFEWLGKAVDAGFARPDHIEGDSDLDGLRADARFADFKKRVEAKAGEARKAGPAVFEVTTKRQSARVAFFGGSSAGQLAIDYGPITWKEKYDELIGSPKFVGKKWRFGKDCWTSLDSSLDIAFGEVSVPAGYYYLTLEHKGENKFVLGLHDAAAVKKLRLDASQAEKLQGGIEVPLEHAMADETASELQIAITTKKGDSGEKGDPKGGLFVVQFGKHRLTAPVRIALQ